VNAPITLRPGASRTSLGVNAGIALAHVGNYIYFPILVATLGATYSGFWAGFVMFLTYVGRLSATFCYAGVTARLGNRRTVVLGVLIEAVPLGLMGFAHGVAAFGALAFVVGFGSGISFPGLKNILGAFPAERRARAFAGFQMACQLGALAGALAGGLFLGVPLPVLFGVVFALFLGYCLAATFLIPADPPAAPPADPPAARPGLVSLDVVRGLQLRGAGRYFLLSSVFWVLSISFLVGIPLHMSRYVPQWPTSVPFWVTGATLILAQYPAFRFMIRHLRPGQVMAVAFAAMALAYLAFGAGRTAGWVLGGCVVVVFGDILFTPGFDLWVADRLSGDRLTGAMGAMHFFRSAGNMVGTLVAGTLFDLSRTVGIPGLNWYVVAALATGCALVCLASARGEVAKAEPDGLPQAA
jgi:MFS transporter, DHA1 family, multidrug resistance protein